MKKVNNNYINSLLVLLIIYVLYLLRDLWMGVAVKLLAVLTPFIVAFAIAYALYPFERWLEKKKIPKVLAVFIIVLLVLGFLAIIVYSLIPIFTEQLFTFFSSMMKFVNDIGSKFDIDITPIKENLTEIFTKLSKDMSKYISDGAINFVNTSINFLSNSIIVFVTFIYFLSDMQKIRDRVDLFFRKKGKKTHKLVKDIDYETTQYFKGLFLTIVIQFFEYTLVFKLIGHPNFLLLGVLCSVSTVIPYFGGFFVNIIAIMIASVISPKLLILTLIVSLIFPNIDGYIISPRVYGKTNNISPLLTIFAVFAGGVLGGFVGILIALPLTIILRTIYRHYEDDIKEKIDDIKDKM